MLSPRRLLGPEDMAKDDALICNGPGGVISDACLKVRRLDTQLTVWAKPVKPADQEGQRLRALKMLEEVVEPNLGESIWGTADLRHVALEVGSTGACSNAILRGKVHVQVAPAVDVAASQVQAPVLRGSQAQVSALVGLGLCGR